MYGESDRDAFIASLHSHKIHGKSLDTVCVNLCIYIFSNDIKQNDIKTDYMYK